MPFGLIVVTIAWCHLGRPLLLVLPLLMWYLLIRDPFKLCYTANFRKNLEWMTFFKEHKISNCLHQLRGGSSCRYSFVMKSKWSRTEENMRTTCEKGNLLRKCFKFDWRQCPSPVFTSHNMYQTFSAAINTFSMNNFIFFLVKLKISVKA